MNNKLPKYIQTEPIIVEFRRLLANFSNPMWVDLSEKGKIEITARVLSVLLDFLEIEGRSNSS